MFAGAIAGDPIRLRQGSEDFVGDEAGVLVDGEFTLAVGGPSLDVQNFAVAFHVDVLAGRHILQAIRGAGIAGNIPHAPE